MDEAIKRLRALFNGLQRAHGVYDLTAATTSAKGKKQGQAITVIEDIHDGHWADHLKGGKGLGIIPIMDDARCGFGAIDVDVYDLNLTELENKIRSLHLPLVLCRTKSGGAHLYLFFKEPIRADLVRMKLADWAVALGHPGVEIFPKQDAMASADDVGNWINMPYHGGAETVRYAIDEGKQLGLEEFLDVAEQSTILVETLEKINVARMDELADAPPCLQSMCINGVPEGTRNDVLLALGVFTKMKYENDWDDQLSTFNQKYFDPPLSFKEVNDTVGSLKKKDYFYPCKREPFLGNCSLQICKMREFGISKGEATDPGVMVESITQITTDPPIWFVSVNGVRLQMTSDDLLSQIKFSKRVLDNLRQLPKPLKAHVWRDLINKLLQTAEVVIAPQDAGPEGLFWHYLEKFCTQRAQAKRREELLLGKPWTDMERTYFRSADLMQYLEKNRFRDFKTNQVYAVLRSRRDVKHEQFNLKGACVQCWSIPEFPRQDEPFERDRVNSDVEC